MKRKKQFGLVCVVMALVFAACAESEGSRIAESNMVTLIPEPTESTEVPEPTESTEVPEPTEAPEATEAPEPTEVPEAPEPTEAPGPTAAPEPTGAPEPTAAPEATVAPAPTETPAPTPTEMPHEHNYTESISFEETCEANGEKVFTCACGDSYTEVIKANGHSYGKYVYNNDATQKADGTKSRTCSVCGKVETKIAEGTKLPFDPYSLRAVTSLDEIDIVGTLTSEDSSLYHHVRKNIEAGKYEKIRYIASNGEQFCMWNVRLKDERNKEDWGIAYYWFVAPVEEEFVSGYQYSNLTGADAANADRYMITVGMNISSSINESMLNRDESIPLAFRVINSTECPVDLYEIVETDTMVSVWVESTNCGQEGIGTCGTFDCKQTCLRYKTLETLRNIPAQKGWTSHISGENGRINWNGKLLVNFYYMKY